MEVVESLECECNGRLYPNRTALNAHKRTKLHKNWETENELHDIRCRCKKLENENEALKYDLNHYRKLVQILSDQVTLQNTFGFTESPTTHSEITSLF